MKIKEILANYHESSSHHCGDREFTKISLLFLGLTQACALHNSNSLQANLSQLQKAGQKGEQQNVASNPVLCFH
ncbi:MAG: hypothetical protein KKE11_02760 [Gammaproteobacteria bacterium]|nr:hypothetical protein [Gammaproteobacteria bacterium]